MKKITLLMATVLLTSISFAQVVVKLTSVPCNTALEGTYPYGESGWAAQPDLLIGTNAVSGPLELINDGVPGFVNDGTPPANYNGIGSPLLPTTIPRSVFGCDTLGNPTQDMTGKIAVIYRGNCEFGYKAYNAQKRGAVGVIIINHTGDPIPMGAGALGNLVTIPVVMVGRIAGDDLFLAMQSCAPGSVMGFIGSKIGLNDDDMGSSIADIVMPNELSIPSNVAVDGTNYPIDLGFWAFNYGNNAQNGVTATVDIVYEGGSSVYNNTSTPLNFQDFVTLGAVDTQYFDLGTFAPASWNQGEYKITYTLNLPGDQDPTDNTFVVNFRVTADVFAKSRTTAGNQPISSTSYSLNTTTTSYDFWQPCIVFQSPVVGTQAGGGILTGMTFSCTPVNQVMTGEYIQIRAYEWNDPFTDITGTVTFASLNQIADNLYLYPGTPDSLDNIYLDFAAPVALNNNQKYLFCMYNDADILRIGFDAQIDYTATINNYLQVIAPVSDQPTAGTETWYRDGFGWDVTPAISATIDFPTAVNNVTTVSTTAPYPNPAVNMLSVPVRKGVKGVVTVEVYDLAGKLVLSDNKTVGEGPLKINVASISNGAYIFNLQFADGSKDTFKVSVNR